VCIITDEDILLLV
jgi:hypothetical protein